VKCYKSNYMLLTSKQRLETPPEGMPAPKKQTFVRYDIQLHSVNAKNLPSKPPGLRIKAEPKDDPK
jgi:hypothetical protein